MKAKKRYAILVLLFFVGGTCRIFVSFYNEIISNSNVSDDELHHGLSNNNVRSTEEPALKSYLNFEDISASLSVVHDANEIAVDDVALENRQQKSKAHGSSISKYKSCTMHECFNFSRCENSFKIYIYPEVNDATATVETGKLSEGYSKILKSLKRGNFYTENPDEACLFVLSFDTLDRDILSGDYVKNLRSKFASLPDHLWNGGLNHLIFNLYPGTWPNYDPMDLGFDPGRAIIAKASFSVDHFRAFFDVSLPLFHKTHPLSGQQSERYNHFDAGVSQQRSYLLVFKGKRYVHGIGSETRNSLYHLHNGRDVIMLTTCRHGKNWKQVKDERCDVDNAIYDEWDYEELFLNSSFCLIPRGRRLGSFRFLEVMEAGCIPVILSNEWELPFSEVIDWKSAVVWADEKLLFQLPSFLRAIPLETVMKMRQQAKHLSRLYFSTVEQIVFTTLEIIKQRLRPWAAPDLWMWNRWTGGVKTFLSNYSDAVVDYPTPFLQHSSDHRFTALVSVSRFLPLDLPLVWKLISRLLKSKYTNNIYVIFRVDISLPTLPFSLATTKRVKLISMNKHAPLLSTLKMSGVKIETEAVFFIDSQVALNTDEIEFAFDVWRWFQHRLVGYFAFNHFWDIDSNRWRMTSALSNSYSIVSDLAVVFHRYYLHYYEYLKSGNYHLSNTTTVDDCFDVKLNLLVTELTGKPPIKLSSMTLTPSFYDYFEAKRKCFNNAMLPSNGVAESGNGNELSLEKSCVRFDPVLYKDPVSNLRKKFKQMEIIRS